MTDYTCDIDCWTDTGKTGAWLMRKMATRIHSAYGFDFYENPITGDMSPVLAIRANAGANGTVWNTQDFDLPTQHPLRPW